MSKGCKLKQISNKNSTFQVIQSDLSSPIVGGHLTIEKGHKKPSQKGHKELPGSFKTPPPYEGSD